MAWGTAAVTESLESCYCDGIRWEGGGGGGDWRVGMAWGTAAVTESLESCYCDGIRWEGGGRGGWWFCKTCHSCDPRDRTRLRGGGGGEVTLRPVAVMESGGGRGGR